MKNTLKLGKWHNFFFQHEYKKRISKNLAPFSFSLLCTLKCTIGRIYIYIGSLHLFFKLSICYLGGPV